MVALSCAEPKSYLEIIIMYIFHKINQSME